LGRSVAERVPMLRARRGNGRFLRTNVIYRRFLAALERTEFLNPIGASTALNIEVPQAAENHTLSILEIEFPARIAECQSKHIGPEFELDILIRSSPAIDATHVSCGAKLQSSPTAAPVALNVGQQTDEHGWRRVEGALRADEEPTVAILRLGYGELSVLLPERQIPRAKELTLAKSKDQPVQRSIVVVERLAPAVAVGPATLVPQPEDVDENISLAVAAWTIGKRIGKGSYGKVYRAVHELTQQHAVVKLIDTSEKNAAERFRREASCLGTLTHPAIPSILDAGFIKKEELAYIVQEHLSGSDLERLFEAGWRPSEAETLEILRQVTMPLAVAHELGIIHRDLKPSNLFLEDLPYRRIRVLDFGCAKLIGASRLTSSGATVGALPYQPPEAFGGKTVEAPADVWTLAVTAYELLAGTHPFLDEDVPKTVGRILSRTYEPLDANKYPALAPIIDACLQVNPDHRPANAEELRALLDGQTTVRTSNESGAPPPVKPDASSPAPSIDVGVVVEGSQQEPIAAASSSTPNTSEIAPAEDATNGGHPAPRRLNRDSVKEEERTEYQGELLVRPIGDCDINATELRSEFDALVRTGIGGRVLKIMMRTQPVREARGFRWTAQNRPYGNVISKWELDLFDDAQLAFRWAKFTTGDLLLFDSLELLDGVVIPLNLYERALVAAAASVGGTTPAKLACRIASLGSRELTLDDRAQVTTVSMYSGKSDPTWDATLQSAFPQPLNTISKRLVNRALQNFRVERDRFEDPSTPAPIISLSQGGFQRYLTSAGLIENPT
jgi:eukaryotic-like serine/threonine-protein kinase